MEKKSLILAVDMNGCPNRCKHCWLGHMPNIKMNENDDNWIVNYFKPYFETITYYSWLREPDYCDNYQKRWIKDNEISINKKPQRFELASFYKLVRDENYVRFLKDNDVKKVQLTFFGLDKMTDKYIGRKGAFNELIKATNILIENEIAPRWQVFINEENKDEIIKLLFLSKEMKLIEKCQAFNSEFVFFIHCGSCDGENMKLYNVRLNKENLPSELIPYFIDCDENMTEEECCQILKDNNDVFNYQISDNIVLNISNRFDVYFNFTHMKSIWKIGNLKKDNKEELINKIVTGNTKALNLLKEIKIKDLIKKYGDFSSHKLFLKDDYLTYLLNLYLYEKENNI